MQQGLGGAKKERIFLLIDCIEIARKERESTGGGENGVFELRT